MLLEQVLDQTSVVWLHTFWEGMSVYHASLLTFSGWRVHVFFNGYGLSHFCYDHGPAIQADPPFGIKHVTFFVEDSATFTGVLSWSHHAVSKVCRWTVSASICSFVEIVVRYSDFAI